MKTTIAVLGFTATILCAVISCNKKNLPAGNGAMTVKMKDDPADLDSVNVEVVGVDVHYSGSNNGWISLPTNTGIYNLLDLHNNVTAVLSSNAGLPAGDINQMRLILGSQNYVVEDSLVSELLLSSQDKTGLKFNLNATINPGDTVEVLIDFDAGESVIQQGNGSYRLKPVIDVEDIIYY